MFKLWMTKSHLWGHPRVHPGSINSRKLFQATFLSAGHTTRTSNAAERSIILMGTWRLQLIMQVMIEHWVRRKHPSNYLFMPSIRCLEFRHQCRVWLWFSVCRPTVHYLLMIFPLQGGQTKAFKYFLKWSEMICDSVNCSISVSMERITGCKGSASIFFFVCVVVVAKVNSLTFLFLPLPTLQVSTKHL